MLTAQEVAQHSTRESCWIIIAGQVYDVTDFLDQHAGGPSVILRYAGRDATEEYEPTHSPTALQDNLPAERRLGPVDPTTVTPGPRKALTGSTTHVLSNPKECPSLSTIISLQDFEEVAKERLSRKTWAYYSSGATDMASLALNRSSWNSILFVPRVMIDVTNVDMSTTLSGYLSSLPIIIAPTGMSKLSHPRGEMCFAEAAGLESIPFTLSTNASAGLDQTIESRGSDDMCFLFQLYMNRDRPKSTALLQKIASYRAYKHPKKPRLFKAIVITIDCPAPGKREPDEKVKAEGELDMGVNGGKTAAPDLKGGGIGRAMASYIDTNVTWKDIAWIREQIQQPALSQTSSSSSTSSQYTQDKEIHIGVKGIQCVADVMLAIQSGLNIIWLSNHGGRGLDTAPPALYVLCELRRDHPWVFSVPGVEFYVDGGIRRGTDVVKAICLGARGVALGRPFVYALQYGTEGVRHAIQIIRDEIETTMKLIGATRISDLGPHYLNTKALQPLLNDPIPNSIIPNRILSPVRAKL